MDSHFSSADDGESAFEDALEQSDERAADFITSSKDTENINPTDAILSAEALIPNQHEVRDTVSWAARTSLPPI